MNRRWTRDDIHTLAPDTASLTAAGTLTRRWSEHGWHGTAVWGICAGSGAQHYRTIVDLSGPAYHCSCPSRKLPCKHALSLLLRWAADEVDELDDYAEFAANWLETREGRKAAIAAASSRTKSSATAQQRRQRVGAGLEELDIWLADQVRTGLAHADCSFGTFETVAARMVDAQAPGIATTLRRLPALVATRSDWPAALLRCYAKLHLLIAAHRRIDQLDCALAATVRNRIGYPIAADEVRGEPGVRDHWLVLGIRVEQEGNLHTRSTWLRGWKTRRWAMIIEHSHGAAHFTVDIPAAGYSVDAELHFYPAAAGLRALFGNREPTHLWLDSTAPAEDSDTIATALSEYAETLGADPWVDSWPVLLRDVVPVCKNNTWYIAEHNGTALELASLGEPWQLLSVSGGNPITVFGEWNGDRLTPISVFDTDEVCNFGNLGAPFGKPHTEADLSGLVSVALLGTARKAFELDQLADPVAAAAAHSNNEAAIHLLETAALQDAFITGGAGASSAVARSGTAPPDARPLLPPAAADRLLELLQQRSGLLTEWFATARTFGYRAPNRLCGELLRCASENEALRGVALDSAGARGRWLAEQVQQWHNLIRYMPAEDGEDEDIWRLGQPTERTRWLAETRARDPQRARSVLEAGWRNESGPGKAALLGVLGEQLSATDEPLLESALDDRRADVRRTAAWLLQRLPESAFSQRMRARIDSWVHIEYESSGGRIELVIEVPDGDDTAARRDGISDHTAAANYRWNGAPDMRAGRLRQAIAATELQHWPHRGCAPDELGNARIDNRYRDAVFDGLMDAALTQQNTVWARMLFELGVRTDQAILRQRELFALLPSGERVEYLRGLDSRWPSDIEALLPAIEHPWPDSLAQHLLQVLFDQAQVAARTGTDTYGTYQRRSMFDSAALHMPTERAETAAALASRCEEPGWQLAFDQLANNLNDRSIMLEELQ